MHSPKQLAPPPLARIVVCAEISLPISQTLLFPRRSFSVTAWRPSPEAIRRAEANQRQTNKNSSDIAQYLLKGWTLTSEVCPVGTCSVPLVRNKEKQMFCVQCQTWAVKEADFDPSRMRQIGQTDDQDRDQQLPLSQISSLAPPSAAIASVAASNASAQSDFAPTDQPENQNGTKAGSTVSQAALPFALERNASDPQKVTTSRSEGFNGSGNSSGLLERNTSDTHSTAGLGLRSEKCSPPLASPLALE